MGGVAKAVGKVVEKVVDTTVDVFITIPGKIVSKGVESVGDIVGKVPGLDSLGREIERWGEDLDQVVDVLSGEYSDDVKQVEAYQRALDERGRFLDTRISKYNLTLDELIDRMDSLVAFDEIFRMALGNRMEEYERTEKPELEKLMNEYNSMTKTLNAMIYQLKSDYDFVIGLTEGAFLQRMIGSVIMIVGGLVSDLRSISDGSAKSETYKRFITSLVVVIAVVMSWGAAATATTAAAPWLVAAAVMASIAGLMQLDGMYANGAATGAIMGALDFLFNDVLQLDSLIGSDFKHFDNDNADYQQMVGYTKMAISLGSIATAWKASMLNGISNTAEMSTSTSNMDRLVGSQQWMSSKLSTGYAQTSKLAEGTIGNTMIFGVKFSTYSDIYKAYSTAQEVGDMISMNKQYEDMKDKLDNDISKLNTAIISKTTKSMMKHYKDSAYFLQDQQEYIDRYVWSMTSQNMYVDPYGTTPVANIRFTPDSDTRMMYFGYEDVFSESAMAGSRQYFNTILYGGL